jgi:hypothetical protein
VQCSRLDLGVAGNLFINLSIRYSEEIENIPHIFYSPKLVCLKSILKLDKRI